MSRFNRTLLSFACLVGLIACNSDSNPVGPESAQTFTAAELMSAANSIGGTTFGIRSLESSQTVSCPLGGSVQVSPYSSTFTNEGIGEAEMQFVHNNCRVADDHGRTWTFSGRPSLRVSLSAKEVGTGSGEIQMAMRGNVRFATDNRSGDCAIDMLFVFRFYFSEAEMGTLRFKGTMCGQPIDETRPFRFF